MVGEAVLRPRDVGEEQRANPCFSLPGVGAARGRVGGRNRSPPSPADDGASPFRRENLRGVCGTMHGAGLVSLALPSCFGGRGRGAWA